MSSPPLPTVAAPPYDDAEKGTVDPNVRAIASLNYSTDEKKGGAVNVAVVPASPVKTEASKPAPAKPVKKPASKWIVFILWYNTYRKLFTICFSLNMVAIGCTAAGYWPYGNQYMTAFILGNFQFSVMVRNELFLRTLYWLVNTLFAKWSPHLWRLGCTSVLQHLGGIHSGCALSGFAWLIYRVVTVFREANIMTNSILAWGVITNFVIFVSVVSGQPWVRNSHHNVFERYHRYFGWSGLISAWIFVILGHLWNSDIRQWNLSARHLFAQQDIWYVFLMSFYIIQPWAVTRSVPIDIEIPSPKVAVLRFRRGMQQGLLARISRSAIWEYHAFGVISEGPYAKYHYLICGVQGDFTKSLVNDPPTHIWTRELKLPGVSNTSTLYRRGIRICTGTGIGAALATCIQSPYWYLIWIGSDQEKTFGPTISGLIHRHLGPERLLLWDSRARGGRPDPMKILREVYHSWQAEVVFITSNYMGNAEIMQGCKKEGIPAFGTLWDF